MEGALTYFPLTEVWLDRVCELERECIPTSWSRESIAAEVCRDEGWSRGIALGEKLVAYFIAYRVASELHILSLGVSGEYRRRGLARELFQRVMRECAEAGVTELFLEVRASNLPAQALYLSLGFSYDGLRAEYYSDNGEDALVFSARAPFLT